MRQTDPRGIELDRTDEPPTRHCSLCSRSLRRAGADPGSGRPEETVSEREGKAIPWIAMRDSSCPARQPFRILTGGKIKCNDLRFGRKNSMFLTALDAKAQEPGISLAGRHSGSRGTDSLLKREEFSNNLQKLKPP